MSTAILRTGHLGPSRPLFTTSIPGVSTSGRDFPLSPLHLNSRGLQILAQPQRSFSFSSPRRFAVTPASSTQTASASTTPAHGGALHSSQPLQGTPATPGANHLASEEIPELPQADDAQNPKPQPQEFFRRLTRRYEGVEGGIIFRGKLAQRLTKQYPVLGRINNVLVLAPFAKWVLAITPLYGAMLGLPEVWDIDLMQSGALCFTGLVWTYYCLLVRPTAWMLVLVNFVLLCVNGYNVWRRLVYDFTEDKGPEAGTSVEDQAATPAAAPASP